MDRAIKNWWIWVLIGILYVVLGGFLLFTNPFENFIALSQLMVAFFFVTGFFEIFYALTNRNVHGWGFNLAMGILQVFIGGYIIINANKGLPEMMAFFLIMFWLIFYGISAIAFSFSLRKLGVPAWWLTLLIGILGLLIGLAMPYYPAASVAFVMNLLGAVALIAGLYSLYFGFAIRRFRA